MYRLKQFSILLGDLTIFCLALLTAVMVRSRSYPAQEFLLLLPHFLTLFCLVALILFVAGLYDISQFKHNRLYSRIFSAGVATIGTGVLYFYVQTISFVAPKTILAFTTLFAFLGFTLWRKLQGRYLSSTRWQTRVVFAGFDEQATALVHYIAEHPEEGNRVVGFLNPKNEVVPQALLPYQLPIAQKIEQLKNQDAAPDVIVLAPLLNRDNTLLNDLYAHMDYQFETVELSDFFETVLHRVPPFIFSEGWFLTNLHERTNKIYDRFRILIDYALALVILAIFLITFPFIALAIKATSPGPIFFRQGRVGRGGSIFSIFKYRSMKVLAPDGSAEVSGPQFTATDDPRITSAGKILRKFRLDELPQCLNVLQGTMAIIGPRPERPEFVHQLTEKISFYPLRHIVKPGFTGWAQVQNSYYGTIDENLRKLEYDIFYVKHRGPLLDLAIILRTIGIVVGMKGR